MTRAISRIICFSLIVFVICSSIVRSQENILTSRTAGILLPLPPVPELDSRKITLGEKLFNDPILSGNKSLACASCHELSLGGDDHQQFSLNTQGERRTINTPTVFNVTHNFKPSIAGTTDSLDIFYRVNLFGKKAMNNTWPKLLKALNNTPHYSTQFADVYPDGITQDSVIDVMLTFQQSLVTPGSAFDQWLFGNDTAISEQEKRGYGLFQVYGCTACHQGKNIGGNLYQKLGVFEDYYTEENVSLKTSDYGLYNKTNNEEDRFYFRVPSLRNVATTAPYLHDGSIDKLDDVIAIMGQYQLGRKINQEDRSDIAAFLTTLTGTYQGKILGLH